MGKKAYQALKRLYSESTIDNFADFANPTIKFEIASSIRDKVLNLYENDEISECYLIYTEFKSAISQSVEALKNFYQLKLKIKKLKLEKEKRLHHMITNPAKKFY